MGGAPNRAATVAATSAIECFLRPSFLISSITVHWRPADTFSRLAGSRYWGPLPAISANWLSDKAHRVPNIGVMSAPELVGRDRELTTIDAALARAAGGKLAAVLIQARPGL